MKKYYITFLIAIPVTMVIIMSIIATPRPTPEELAPPNIANNTDQTGTIESSHSMAFPQMTVDKTDKYTAVLNTTAGKITIELNAADTPLTVNNFAYLATAGFYNGTQFHRIIKGFMIQGGDPNNNGTGNPGYTFKDEPIVGDYLRGTVAMANAGPNTNGSQFFIMQNDVTQMPKSYVIFGKVVTGMDVVDKIANAPVVANEQGEMAKPVKPVAINSVDIIISSAK